MSIVTKDYEIESGSTKEWEFRISIEGLTQNLTGWKLFFTLKEKFSDSDDNAIIKKDITDHYSEEEGKSRVTLTSTDTNLSGNYYYDFKLVSNDIVPKVWYLLSGSMLFTQSIGRRIS